MTKEVEALLGPAKFQIRPAHTGTLTDMGRKLSVKRRRHPASVQPLALGTCLIYRNRAYEVAPALDC
jgi:hypothetical protein